MNRENGREMKAVSFEQFAEMDEQYAHEISKLEEIQKDLCCELSKIDENKLPQLFQTTYECILSIEKALDHLSVSHRILGELRVGPYDHALNERISF